MDEHQKRFIKILRELSCRHSGALNDWATMSAISIYNAVTPRTADWTEREDRYKEIAKQYESEQRSGLAEMLACIVKSLDAGTAPLHDCLGEMYMTEEMRSRYDTDVTFTPFHVSYMIAKIAFGENPIPEKGYLTIGEPACGTGGMIIAAAQALKDVNLNYQRVMHVTATDVRLPLAQMAYIQLSLLHIPAVVIHGNSLSLETWSRWHTPAHVLGFWGVKLRRDQPQSPAVVPVGTSGKIDAGVCTNMQEGKPQFSFDFEMPADYVAKKPRKKGKAA